MDLTAMIFKEFKQARRVLHFDPPLVLESILDEETRQLLVVSDEGLDIHVFAQTCEQLADDLAEKVFFLWDEYANEFPDSLADKAKSGRVGTYFVPTISN